MKIYADEKAPEMTETEVRFCVGGAMRILAAPGKDDNVEEVAEIIKNVMSHL